MNLKLNTELPKEEQEMLSQDPLKNKRIDKDDDWYYSDTTLRTNSHLGLLQKGGPLHLINFDVETAAKVAAKEPLDFTPEEELEDLDAEETAPEKEKAHHIFGKALHCLVLEPHRWNKLFWLFDDEKQCKKIIDDSPENKKVKSPRATNLYKDWKAAEEKKHIGKICITKPVYTAIHAIKERLLAIPIVRQLLENTIREAIYQGSLMGVGVKVKPDAIRPTFYGVEIKTMREAVTKENFLTNLKKYSWHRQSAFYADILGLPTYWIIACEKSAPYTIGVFEVSEETRMQGRSEYTQLLLDYKANFIDRKIDPVTYVVFDKV